MVWACSATAGVPVFTTDTSTGNERPRSNKKSATPCAPAKVDAPVSELTAKTLVVELASRQGAGDAAQPARPAAISDKPLMVALAPPKAPTVVTVTVPLLAVVCSAELLARNSEKIALLPPLVVSDRMYMSPLLVQVKSPLPLALPPVVRPEKLSVRSVAPVAALISNSCAVLLLA